MMPVIPKYYQVKTDIIHKIEGGVYKPHQLLPSEQQFQKDYEVSRITVRKALDDLYTEGLVYKVQGKGTYVAATVKKGVDFTSSDSSCLADLEAQGFTAKRIILRTEVITCDEEAAKGSPLTVGERYFLFERLYTGDGVPISYEKSHYLYSTVSGIEKYDFSEQSIGRILRDQYYYQLRISRQTMIRAIAADGWVSDMLKLEKGAPVLRAELYAHKNEPGGGSIPCVEWTELYWRTDLVPINFCY